LADGGDFDELVFGIEKNDTQRFVGQKTHLGTEPGNCLGTVDGERLTLLAQRHGAHAQRTSQAERGPKGKSSSTEARVKTVRKPKCPNRASAFNWLSTISPRCSMLFSEGKPERLGMVFLGD
jgi:hypothetical protein